MEGTCEEWGDLPAEKEAKSPQMFRLVQNIRAGLSTTEMIDDNPGLAFRVREIDLLRQTLTAEQYAVENRPLESVYAVVFLDAIHYHVRSEGQIVKKAVYIAIGINLDGRKDVLGMWVGENESAKYWATILNGLRNRGVEDSFVVCTDNLTGFDAAIHATVPQTEIQNCIIHQLRNSSKYVSCKDRKALMADTYAESFCQG